MSEHDEGTVEAQNSAPGTSAPQVTAGDAPANGAGGETTEDIGQKLAMQRRIGQREGKQKVLEQFGRPSEEVLQILEAFDAQQTEVEPTPAKTGGEEQIAQLRETMAKNRTLERQLGEATSSLSRSAARADNALRLELRSKLLEAGASSEVVGDLVNLMRDHVDWAEDSDGLEVISGRDDNGLAIPADKTIDDFIAEQKAARAYGFQKAIAQGSGGNIETSPTPRGNGAQQQPGWKQRVRTAKQGPS